MVAARGELPAAGPDQVVGLFGGSFDPPHAGHLALSAEALKRLELDRLWWLVSPGNPLKARPPAPIEERIAAAKAMIHDPRITVTGLEAQFGTRATIDTLRALRRHYPRVRFVWLMGADNLAQFHRWENWREIMAMVPVAVFARPGQRLKGLTSPAAQIHARQRINPVLAQRLGRMAPPVWCYLDMPMRPESSTALRQARGIG